MSVEWPKIRFAVHGPQPVYWTLALISLVPLCLVVPLFSIKIGVVTLTVWVALLWVAISFARDGFHYFTLIWVAVYPYCYYLLSYPTEHSIFTIDRAFILLLVVEILRASRKPSLPLAGDIQISAYLWTVFLIACLVSLRGHNPADALPSYRYFIDGMVMPAVLGLYALRYFSVLKNLPALHLSSCFLGTSLFVTGLIEMIAGVDLFPWSGSVPTYTNTNLRRADGPFEQQVVLSIVAILVFFFILYLGRLLRGQLSGWRVIVHRIACLSAFGAALLPLDRGLILALVPIAVIDCRARDRFIPRRLWAAFFSLILLSVLATSVFDPRLYEDRVSGLNNVYQRLAQHQETFTIVRNNPLFGVGFGLYYDVSSRSPQNMARWNGIESMNAPHNVLMTVLSEEGVVGLILYILAQAFLIRAMWKIRGVYHSGWLVFLYCILVYVAIGFDYATVSFSDVNLLYVFILCVIYQVQLRIAGAEQESISLVPHEKVA